MSAEHRPYEELRLPIEQRGVSMMHVREGHQWGAWVVSLDGKSCTFKSNGRGYPELDRLYKPKISNPKHYTDYSNDLVPGALETLLRMLQ